MFFLFIVVECQSFREIMCDMREDEKLFLEKLVFVNEVVMIGLQLFFDQLIGKGLFGRRNFDK